MQNSKLQFDNPKLVKIDYEVNEEYSFTESINMNTSAEVMVDKMEADRTASVFVSLKIFDKEDFDFVPFKLNIDIKANFRWDSDLDSRIDQMLNSNAPAILFSYIRPFVTQFTVFSGYPALVLPIFNFVKNKESL